MITLKKQDIICDTFAKPRCHLWYTLKQQGHKIKFDRKSFDIFFYRNLIEIHLATQIILCSPIVTDD
jgi:hypothetical protein